VRTLNESEVGPGGLCVVVSSKRCKIGSKFLLAALSIGTEIDDLL